MDAALMRRKDIEALLADLLAAGPVYAPSPDAGGNLVFQRIESSSDMRLDGTNTLVSAKGLFFPQREILLSFSGSALTGADLPNGSFTVFGIRPCDSRSLGWLDGVFLGPEGADPYYGERRRNALVIAAACDRPGPSCFCTSVGGGPYGTAGADLLLSPAEDGDLLFELLTEKGRRLIEEHAELFRPAGERTREIRREREETARRSMAQADFTGLSQKLAAGMSSPAWERLTRTCLGCGVCAYLCPACHCFDITDERQGARGVRVRSWDSCQFPGFTQHASGHNPRPVKGARVRQRVMHKFSYAVETAGTVYCSGCGRCVRSCPAGLDIRQILAAFQKAGGDPS